MISEVK